jgi:hypothetical protein
MIPHDGTAVEIAIVLTIEDEETADPVRDHTENAHVPGPERGEESFVRLRQSVPAEIGSSWDPQTSPLQTAPPKNGRKLLRHERLKRKHMWRLRMKPERKLERIHRAKREKEHHVLRKRPLPMTQTQVG